MDRNFVELVGALATKEQVRQINAIWGARGINVSDLAEPADEANDTDDADDTDDTGESADMNGSRHYTELEIAIANAGYKNNRDVATVFNNLYRMAIDTDTKASGMTPEHLELFEQLHGRAVIIDAMSDEDLRALRDQSLIWGGLQFEAMLVIAKLQKRTRHFKLFLAEFARSKQANTVRGSRARNVPHYIWACFEAWSADSNFLEYKVGRIEPVVRWGKKDFLGVE